MKSSSVAAGERLAAPRWSFGQRLIHAGLLLGLIGGWWTAHTEADDLHEWLGWGMVALVGARGLVGFGRHPQARWRGMARALWYGTATDSAGRLLWHRRSVVSVLILLLLVLGTGLTGWMLTWETFAGDDAAEQWHAALFNALLGWVGLHVVVVSWLSLRARRWRVLDIVRGGSFDSISK